MDADTANETGAHRSAFHARHVIRDRKLSKLDRAILNHIEDRGECFVRMDFLADAVDCHEDTLSNRLKEMRKLGWIIGEKRRKGAMFIWSHKINIGAIEKLPLNAAAMPLEEAETYMATRKAGRKPRGKPVGHAPILYRDVEGPDRASRSDTISGRESSRSGEIPGRELSRSDTISGRRSDTISEVRSPLKGLPKDVKTPHLLSDYQDSMHKPDTFTGEGTREELLQWQDNLEEYLSIVDDPQEVTDVQEELSTVQEQLSIMDEKSGTDVKTVTGLVPAALTTATALTPATGSEARSEGPKAESDERVQLIDENYLRRHQLQHRDLPGLMKKHFRIGQDDHRFTPKSKRKLIWKELDELERKLLPIQEELLKKGLV